MFNVTKFSSYYCLTLATINLYSSDYEIAEEIDISYKKYQKILKKFNALNGKDCDDDCHFLNKEDAIKTAEYLDEKYGVLLKLLE